MVGPKIQKDLYDILVHNRLFMFAESSDVSKMYRQDLVKQSQSFFQMIICQSNPSEPLLTYEFSTVTYGADAAAFLTMR